MTIETQQYYTSHEQEMTVHGLVADFENTLAGELTKDFAHQYVGSLIEKIGGIDMDPDSFIKEGKTLHYLLGKDTYGPFIHSFIESIWIDLQDFRKKGPIHFALRDAAPFLAAAQKYKKCQVYPVGIYLNRPILGIADEISGDIGKESNPDVIHYLNDHGIFDNTNLMIIDSGAWGTVIKALKTNYIPKAKLEPIFWYSHNPYIQGYINDKLQVNGFSEEIGEVINDSMECVFPQQWKRPTTIVQTAGVYDVILTPNDYLSRIWGEAALEGVKASNTYKETNISKLVALSMKAKQTGEWTGVLPDHTPTWSKGSEFIVQWPTHLLP